MQSMTDVGGSRWRSFPHPTFADAKATFSRLAG
jgi:hypothetical protein